MLSIGIDIGTTSICTICYDNLTEEILRCIYRDNAFQETGNFEQDPEEIVKKVRESMEELLFWMEKKVQMGEIQEEIVGIGVSCQMHGIVYVDKQGKAVTPLYTWKNEFGNVCFREGTYRTYLSERLPYPCYSGYGSVTHFYLQQNKQIPQKAVKFVSIGDYLIMQMCGQRETFVGKTLAASFGGYDLKKESFCLNELEKTGVDISYYPEIQDDKWYSLRLENFCQVPQTIKDLVKNISLGAAVGDNQASFFGAIQNAEDTVSLNVGTGSQISIYEENLYAVEEIEVRPFIGKGYLYVGASLNGGKVYERLGKFLEEVCEIGTGKQINGFQFMEMLGKSVKHTDLLTVPTLYGTRKRQKKVAGIYYLSQENFHAADLVRSFVSGMARELYELYESVPQEIRKTKVKIAASGNGIRKNQLLREEIEKTFQMPVTFSDKTEEAAAGAARYIVEFLKERGLSCRS